MPGDGTGECGPVLERTGQVSGRRAILFVLVAGVP
jgi:hypothetical protein